MKKNTDTGSNKQPIKPTNNYDEGFVKRVLGSITRPTTNSPVDDNRIQPQADFQNLTTKIQSEQLDRTLAQSDRALGSIEMNKATKKSLDSLADEDVSVQDPDRLAEAAYDVNPQEKLNYETYQSETFSQNKAYREAQSKIAEKKSRSGTEKEYLAQQNQEEEQSAESQEISLQSTQEGASIVKQVAQQQIQQKASQAIQQVTNKVTDQAKKVAVNAARTFATAIWQGIIWFFTATWWIWLIILALILLLVLFYFLIGGLEKSGEFSKAAFSSEANPASCRQSLADKSIPFLYSNTLKELDSVNGTISLYNPDADSEDQLLTKDGKKLLKYYANLNRFAYQVTTNIINSGDVYDYDRENSNVFNKKTTYGDGIVLPNIRQDDDMGALLKNYLATTIPGYETDGFDPKSADGGFDDDDGNGLIDKDIKTLTGYDANRITVGLEGITVNLEPGETGAYDPTGISVTYVNAASEKGDVKAGIIDPIVRATGINESYGMNSAIISTSFSQPKTPQTDFANLEGKEYEALTPEQKAVVDSWATDGIEVYATKPIDASADEIIKNRALGSYVHVSVGLNIKFKIVGTRIPVVSEIIESIVNSILDGIINIDALKFPVYTNTFYEVANIGTVADRVLGAYDPNQKKPFATVQDFPVLKNANESVDELMNRGLLGGIENISPEGKPIGRQEPKESGENRPGDTQAAEDQINNDPDVQRLKQLKDANGTLNYNAQQYRSIESPLSILTVTQSLTEQLRQAASGGRQVNGGGFSIKLNIAVNVISVVPLVFTVGVDLPTISGSFVRKNITGAPTGDEFVDLYNRVTKATIRMMSDPRFERYYNEAKQSIKIINSTSDEDLNPYNFVLNQKDFAKNAPGVVEQMEAWEKKCKNGIYDTVASGSGSSITGALGLASCRLYESPGGYVLNYSDNFVTDKEKSRLTSLGIENTREMYENLILAAFISNGYNPEDGYNDQNDRAMIAWAIANAAYETNPSQLSNQKPVDDTHDFKYLTEIDPQALVPIQDVIAKISNGDFAGVGDALKDTIQGALSNLGITQVDASAGPQLLSGLLKVRASLAEAYGPLGEGAYKAAVAPLNTALNNLPPIPGINVKFQGDIDSYIISLYKSVRTNSFPLLSSGDFESAFQPNSQGIAYYGMGLAPRYTRGLSVYQKLNDLLSPRSPNENLVQRPMILRERPGIAAEVFVKGLLNGAFTGKRLDEFFKPSTQALPNGVADSVNARAVLDKDFKQVSTDDEKKSLREGEYSELFRRIQKYETQLKNRQLNAITASQVCEKPGDNSENIIAEQSDSNKVCIQEGFSYINNEVDKEYVTYGLTIRAPEGSEIRPLFPGKIFLTNYGQTPATEEGKTEEEKEEQKNQGPAAGNQISIISRTRGGTNLITRYTNLQGKTTSKTLPGTSVGSQDVIGYVGKSGKNITDPQVRIEILQYVGKGPEASQEQVINSILQSQNFALINPREYIGNDVKECADIRKDVNHTAQRVARPANKPNLYIPDRDTDTIQKWLTLKE